MEFKSCYICNKKSESVKSALLNCIECLSCRVCKNEDYCKHLLCAECFTTFDPLGCNLCNNKFKSEDELEGDDSDTLEEDMMELEDEDDIMELEDEDDMMEEEEEDDMMELEEEDDVMALEEDDEEEDEDDQVYFVGGWVQ